MTGIRQQRRRLVATGGAGNAIGSVFVTLDGALGRDNRHPSLSRLGLMSGGAHQQRKQVEQSDINGVLLRSTDETMDAPVSL